MTEDELSQIYGVESNQLDYKYVLPPPKALARDIAALANTDGGEIIVGIEQGTNRKLSVVGLSKDIPIHDVINAALMLLRPFPDTRYHYQDIDSKSVLVIHVEKNPVPILTEDGYYYKRKSAINARATEDDFRTAVTKIADVKQAEANFKTPHEEESRADYEKVDQLLKRFKENKNQTTQSKLALVDHYASLFHLVNLSSDILYPTDASIPTTVPEGKVCSGSGILDTEEKQLEQVYYVQEEGPTT